MNTCYLRKDNPLVYQMMQTRKYEVDIRDMRNATWRDIVADAMEDFHGTADLEQIYLKIGQHSRTSEQQYWKEKVRQTLQSYKNIFTSPKRGVWSLVKYSL